MAHLGPWREFSRVASFLSWLLKGATKVDKSLYLNQLDLCEENCHELCEMESGATTRLRTARGRYSSQKSGLSTGVERASNPLANDETSVDGD